MTGKTPQTNCPTLSAEGIAARLQREDAPPLCLLPDAATATQIKRALPGVRRVPTLLPLSQLLTAAAHLPLDERLPESAALLPPPAGGGTALPWQMFAALRPYCKGISAAARLQLAKKLAALFAEVDAYLPLAAGENPFAALQQGGSYEAGVAAAMWELFAEESLVTQSALRQVATHLPPFLAVCDASTTPVQRAFYAQHAAEVVTLQPAAAEAVWHSAFTTAGALPAQCVHHAREGAGETLSHTAQLALRVLQEWLVQHQAEAAGEQGIGVVVYDRLLARRLRAMAEAAGILIADKGGWRAETLSYGAALAHSAALLLDAFSLTAVQQVLQAPFYAETPTLPRAAAAWRNWLSEEMNLPATADALQRQCAQREDGAPLLPLLQAQAQARAQAAPAMWQPVQWLHWLETATAELCAAWREDGVAQQLRHQLLQRAEACTPAAVEFSAAEFLLWLQDALADERVSEDEVHSAVAFVQPGSARRFDALLLLGCGGTALSEAQGWLGEGERAALQLPAVAQRVQRERVEFSCHLAHHTQVAAVWNALDAAGSPQPPHPFWTVFAAHCRAHQRMQEIRLPPPPPVAPLQLATAAAWQRAKMPAKLHLSGVETALKCPYLFYSEKVLNLQDETPPEIDEVSPLLAGNLLHRALARFAQESHTLQEDAALQACWEESVAQILRGNRPGLHWLQQYWCGQSDALVQWEQARRAAGWRMQQVEHEVEVQVPLPQGGAVTLSGRIDRLDEAADGALAVVDYKSGSKPSWRDLAQGELPQLPLYAFLMELEGAAVREQLLCRPHRRDAWAVPGEAPPKRVAARLRRVLFAAAGGAALPANGTLSGACVQCAAAGLCRREHWQS